MTFRLSGYLIILLFLGTEVFGQSPTIQNGILNLRGHDWQEHPSIQLDGDWGFYWMEFGDPASTNEPLDFIYVPSPWNQAKTGSDKLGAIGYATYRLKILSDPSLELSLRTTIISTAYRMFINGELVASNGRPDTSSVASIPEYRPLTINIEQSDEIVLVLHVSNYHHRVGGIRDKLILGKRTVIVANERNDLLIDFFLAGCFIMMGMYHVVLYLIKEDKSPLYFSIFCLVITIRLAVTGHIPVSNFLSIPWAILIRIEYLSFYLGAIAFLRFFNSLFRQNVNQKIVNGLTYFLSFMSLLVVLLPTIWFTQLLIISQLAILVMVVYTFIVLRSAHKDGNREVVIFATGYFFLLFFFLNDILYADEIIETSHLFSAGLFIFLISQAVLLSRRYAFAFKQNEELLEQLNSSNKILESKVVERTAILEDQKKVLEKSNDQVQLQNDELTKLNQELDNFVYSVSHDLKSPLASILGLIDLSKNEKDLITLHHYHTLMEKSLNRQSEFISEILDYSRNARLESAKETIDFQKMVAASLEQFQFIEDFDKIQKKVLVDQNGEFFSDKQRISVILNNLISNALKYSSVGTEEPAVEISIQSDQKQAFISIKDNGCGIKEGKQEHIFEMFYRADDHKSGSGLGLYIVGETLQKLNATIELDSTYGEGTAVRVIIPSGK